MSNCSSSPLFSAPVAPAGSVHPEAMVVAAVPVAAASLCWCLFWCRAAPSRRAFARGTAAVASLAALAVTGAQGVLVHRGFVLLACGAHLPDGWAIPAVAALVAANCLLVLVVAPRLPLFASGAVLDAAALCVAGEWAGRALISTEAVAVLFPLQLLYCLLSALLLVRAPAEKGPRLRPFGPLRACCGGARRGGGARPACAATAAPKVVVEVVDALHRCDRRPSLFA